MSVRAQPRPDPATRARCARLTCAPAWVAVNQDTSVGSNLVEPTMTTRVREPIGHARRQAAAICYRTVRALFLQSADEDPARREPCPAGCRTAGASAATACAAYDSDAAATYGASGYGAAAPASGYGGAAASAAATCSAAAAAASAATSRRQLYAQVGFPVEDIEGPQADVGDFLLIENGNGIGRSLRLRRSMLRRYGGCRCAARHRQGGPGGSKYRQGGMLTSSLRSLLRARHSRSSSCCEQALAESTPLDEWTPTELHSPYAAQVNMAGPQEGFNIP
jgi:hypothetical protein